MLKKTQAQSVLLSRLGVAISRKRIRQNLTQKQLSVRCGVDRAYLSYVENGKKNLSVVVLATIAEGLGVSIASLFRELEKIELLESTHCSIGNTSTGDVLSRHLSRQVT